MQLVVPSEADEEEARDDNVEGQPGSHGGTDEWDCEDVQDAQQQGKRKKSRKDPEGIISDARKTFVDIKERFNAESLWAGEHRARDVTSAVSRLSKTAHSCTTIPRTSKWAKPAADLASSLLAEKESLENLRNAMSKIKASPWLFVDDAGDGGPVATLMALKPELLMSVVAATGNQIIDKALDEPQLFKEVSQFLNCGEGSPSGLCVGLLLSAGDRDSGDAKMRLELAEQAQESLVLYMADKMFAGKIAQGRLESYFSQIKGHSTFVGFDDALERFSALEDGLSNRTGFFKQAQRDFDFVMLLLASLKSVTDKTQLELSARRFGKLLCEKKRDAQSQRAPAVADQRLAISWALGPCKEGVAQLEKRWGGLVLSRGGGAEKRICCVSA